MQGNLLVGNVIGQQGILRFRLDDKGGSVVGTLLDPILMSSDPNFRPSDFRIGPDGALYFLNWHNPIIGHMQHNLRDPSRDREHGRIYRVTYEGRPLSQSPKSTRTDREAHTVLQTTATGSVPLCRSARSGRGSLTRTQAVPPSPVVQSLARA